MKNCHICGNQLADTDKRCDLCGALQPQQSTQKVAQHTQSSHKSEAQYHPHCPQCKSSNVVPALERQTTEGHSLFGLGRSGIGLGTFSSTTKAEYDWICQNCGVRFPNIHVVEAKIANCSAHLTLALVCVIIAVICAIIFSFKQSWIIVQICLVCVAIYGIVWAFTKKKLENLQASLEFLKYSCYNHSH